MNSRLSAVPIAGRRRLAATLGLFSVLFIAVGAVAATGTGSAAAPVFSAVALVIAALLALMAWGIAHSVKLDLAEQRLDRAIEETMSARGASMCGCGHDHDPDELHVTDACAHDGSGAACAHDCDTCVLAAMRPSPSQTRAERTK
ncbi:MAG TPA: hypothetical protein VFE19_02415 [Jatrophihabitantaceae bacterium]|nr:hypothetical protein [Jatrophihabitantaceae bacterium]